MGRFTTRPRGNARSTCSTPHSLCTSRKPPAAPAKGCPTSKNVGRGAASRYALGTRFGTASVGTRIPESDTFPSTPGRVSTLPNDGSLPGTVVAGHRRSPVNQGKAVVRGNTCDGIVASCADPPSEGVCPCGPGRLLAKRPATESRPNGCTNNARSWRRLSSNRMRPMPTRSVNSVRSRSKPRTRGGELDL